MPLKLSWNTDFYCYEILITKDYNQMKSFSAIRLLKVVKGDLWRIQKYFDYTEEAWALNSIFNAVI